MNAITFLKIFITIIVAFFTMASDCGGSAFQGSETKKTDLGGTSVSAPTNGITFKNHGTLNNYGFDALASSPEAYISIAANLNTTHFVVKVDQNPNNAKAKSQNTSYVDVAAGDNLSNSTENDVTLKSTSTMGGTKVNIDGCTGELTPDPCYVTTTKNSINVKVYNERPITINLTILNNSSFDYTDIKSNIQAYIKQGCLRISNSMYPNSQPYFNQSSYDKNGNTRLDKWITEPFPSDDEFEDFKNITNSNSFWSSSTPGLIVVKNNIRLHWAIYSAVPKDFNIVTLTGKGNIFKAGDVATIGPVSGSGDAEDILIQSVSGNTLFLEYNTSFAHPTTHSVYSDDKMKGWTEENCSVLGENASQRVAAHEFMHSTTAGGLLHVVDVDNLMNPNVDLTGSFLRYREIANPDGGANEKQWSSMSQTSF
jgi:hypothetical protein